MLRILTGRSKAGVDVKIIGKVEAKWELAGENSRQAPSRAGDRP